MTDDFVEDVLTIVERIPPGRVMSYGAIADYLGQGGPRQVGAVMSHYGASVPWHRVVNASGRTPPGHERDALRRLRAEGTALRGERVDMRAAAWYPEDGPDDDPGAPSDRSGSMRRAPRDDPDRPPDQSSRPTPPRRGSPAAPARPTALAAPKK